MRILVTSPTGKSCTVFVSCVRRRMCTRGVSSVVYTWPCRFVLLLLSSSSSSSSSSFLFSQRSVLWLVFHSFSEWSRSFSKWSPSFPRVVSQHLACSPIAARSGSRVASRSGLPASRVWSNSVSSVVSQHLVCGLTASRVCSHNVSKWSRSFSCVVSQRPVCSLTASQSGLAASCVGSHTASRGGLAASCVWSCSVFCGVCQRCGCGLSAFRSGAAQSQIGAWVRLHALAKNPFFSSRFRHKSMSVSE